MNEAVLLALSRDLGSALLARDDTLVTAESCTGGWIATAVTEVPGASAWFEAGFVTYSNRAKMTLLDVPEETLIRHGAVSEETVLAMSRGALACTTGTWAIAVSGIAGPSGGSDGKPVGTVWLNWTSRSGACRSERHVFAGDRAAVRLQAVAAALRGLLDVLAG